jgi:mannose-6-phosphate isomerase-like protein (cupin superfamily)
MIEKTKWGSWQDLYATPTARVKILTVAPGHSLSMQHHLHRSEIWLVIQGTCTVQTRNADQTASDPVILRTHDYWIIPQGDWHKLSNPYEQDCLLIELQYGSMCSENDLMLCDIDQATRGIQYATNNQ